MADFSISFQKTMNKEGVYSNEQSDPGGETYFGISRVKNPDWQGWPLIDTCRNYPDFPGCLSKNGGVRFYVGAFYRRNFWDYLRLDEFEQDISDELFDTAVNQGKRQAAIYFQKSLNLLNRNQRYYKNISEDFMCGEETVLAYRAYMETRPDKTQLIKVLLKALNGFQFMRYVELVESNQVLETFFFGWVLNRC